MAKEKRGDGTVGKALDVLNEVAEIGSPVRFSSLLKTSKYPKATLYRLLQTLVNQDMLSYNDEGANLQARTKVGSYGTRSLASELSRPDSPPIY